VYLGLKRDMKAGQIDEPAASPEQLEEIVR